MLDLLLFAQVSQVPCLANEEEAHTNARQNGSTVSLRLKVQTLVPSVQQNSSLRRR